MNGNGGGDSTLEGGGYRIFKGVSTVILTMVDNRLKRRVVEDVLQVINSSISDLRVTFYSAYRPGPGPR